MDIKKKKNFKEGSKDIPLKSLCLLNFSNWKVIQSNLTYEQAQNLELHHANMGYERGSIYFQKESQKSPFF